MSAGATGRPMKRIDRSDLKPRPALTDRQLLARAVRDAAAGTRKAAKQHRLTTQPRSYH